MLVEVEELRREERVVVAVRLGLGIGLGLGVGLGLRDACGAKRAS